VLGAFVILAVLPLLGRALLRRLTLWRRYRRWPKPRAFDANILVIGGGAAGLVAAYVGAALKAKVILVERERMGGDCLNTGCVPSKALLRSARTAAELRRAAKLGWPGIGLGRAEFGAVMGRVKEVIETVEPHDSAERYRKLGVEVLEGEARLVSPWTVELGDRQVHARAIVLATGARPLIPPLPGMEAVDYLTSESLWRLESLPASLAIVGGGAVGCEMAQAFARLGSHVSVLEMAEQLLPSEDRDVAEEMAEVLREDGVELLLGQRLESVEPSSAETGAGVESGVRLNLAEGGSLIVERLLLAVGRKAVTDGLGLEELGIELGSRGEVPVDRQLRTELPNLLACGDVLGHHQLTHAAAHEAWHAAVNALVGRMAGRSISYSVMPQVIYTEPEFARVGLNEREAREEGGSQGIEYEVTRYDLRDLDRAIADGARRGFVKLLTRKGSDRLLGATIVAERAAEMLTEFELALRHKIGLGKLMGLVRPYPSYAEASRFAAGQWRQAHAPGRILQILARFHTWRRG
jgi:pyruvate/2-oxoglutarate dehydrogenase complex dihydrolipoamide dehydrogenase (E3) component